MCQVLSIWTTRKINSRKQQVFSQRLVWFSYTAYLFSVFESAHIFLWTEPCLCYKSLSKLKKMLRLPFLPPLRPLTWEMDTRESQKEINSKDITVQPLSCITLYFLRYENSSELSCMKLREFVVESNTFQSLVVVSIDRTLEWFSSACVFRKDKANYRC